MTLFHNALGPFERPKVSNKQKSSPNFSGSVERYGNIEAGSYELSKKIAFRIVEKVPGMTLDWLFLKSRDGLNAVLHQRLEVAAMQVAEEHRTRLASARRRAARR